MKTIFAAVAATLTATSAFAGAVSAPVMEPAVVEQASSSSGGVLVPLLVLLVAWAATR